LNALSPLEKCESLLGAAREARSVVIPTPDSILDDPVQDWIEETESLGFDCPRARGNPEGHTNGVRKIRSLEAQINGDSRAWTA